MAAVDWKVLATGKVQNPQAAIYTAPEQVWIKSIRFTQKSVTPQTIRVFLNPAVGDTSEIDYAEDVPQNYKLESADQPITLEAGDSIEAVSTTDDVVEFAIFGGERVP